MPMDEWISLNEAAHIWLSAFEGLPHADGWKTGQDDMSGMAAENLNAGFVEAVKRKQNWLRGVETTKKSKQPTGPTVDIPAAYFRLPRDFQFKLNSISASSHKQGKKIIVTTPLVGVRKPDWIDVRVHHATLVDWVRENLRPVLLRELEFGRIELTAARAKAEAFGIELEGKADSSKFDPKEEGRWTIPMAIAWIASRDIDKVRWQWDTWRDKHSHFSLKKKWTDAGSGQTYEGWFLESIGKASLFDQSKGEVREASKLNQAYEVPLQNIHSTQKDLWGKLKASKILAEGILNQTDYRPIEKHLWQVLEPNEMPDGEDYIRNRINNDRWSGVTVPSEDVIKLWPIKPGAKNNSVEVPKQKQRRGPKPKVDPKSFETEVHRILELEGIPNPILDPNYRQSVLEKQMMTWHNETYGVSRNRALTVKAMASYTSKFETDKGQ